MKGTRQNSFHLDTLSFHNLFSSFFSSFLISVGCPFSTLLLLIHNPKYYSPQKLSSSIIDVFVMQSRQIRVIYYRIRFKGGFRLFIFWLMMKLVVGSNKELRYVHMHIIRVGFERFKLQEWPISFLVSGIV